MVSRTEGGAGSLVAQHNRRRLTQAAVIMTGSAMLVKAGLAADVRRTFAQGDDNSGRGRGRGGEDHSGHGNGDDAEEAATLAQVPTGSEVVRIVGDNAGDFVPGELTVDLGQVVTFVNLHSDEHTATGAGFDTGIIPDEGGMVTVVLDTPGVFPYACQIHPEMTGVIRVRDAGGVVPETRSAAQPVPAEATPVVIANLAFAPAAVTVPTGTTVAWVNDDAVPHTVSAADGAFDSGILDPGNSFAFTFNEPGTFAYVCQLHPRMQGTVTVTGDPVAGGAESAQTAAPDAATPAPAAASAPAESSVSVAIVDFAFEPATIQIAAGDTVVWRNDGAVPHTVTGDFADSGVLEPGQTVSHTFTNEGSFLYACAVHPAMTGSVAVSAAPAAPATPAVTNETRANPSGVWQFEVIPDNAVIFAGQQALLAFHPDAMLDAAFAAASGEDIPANILAAGHGTWRVQGDVWHITLAALMTDAERRFIATVTLDGEMERAADDAARQGPFAFAVIAPDGQSIGQGTGTWRGRPLLNP